jgi:hypothetical protein
MKELSKHKRSTSSEEKPKLTSHGALLSSEEATLRGLRYQIGRYCQGKKDALGPKAVQCLRDILFSQTGLSRASRKLRQQHDNICDLNEEDYDILRGQKLLKLDSHGHVIEPDESCTGVIPMRNSNITDLARATAQSIAGLFPMTEAALMTVHNPIALIVDPNKSSFVLRMVAALIASRAWSHWNIYFSSAFYAAAFVPMYRIDSSCMDFHGLHPVPARFRFQGKMIATAICTLITTFVTSISIGFAALLLVSGSLAAGCEIKSSLDYYNSQLFKVLDKGLSSRETLIRLFQNIITDFLKNIYRAKADLAKFVKQPKGFDEYDNTFFYGIFDLNYFEQRWNDEPQSFKSDLFSGIMNFYANNEKQRRAGVKEESMKNYIHEQIQKGIKINNLNGPNYLHAFIISISNAMVDFFTMFCPSLLKHVKFLKKKFTEFHNSHYYDEKALDKFKLQEWLHRGDPEYTEFMKTHPLENPLNITRLLSLAASQALMSIIEESSCKVAQLLYYNSESQKAAGWEDTIKDDEEDPDGASNHRRKPKAKAAAQKREKRRK